jgi:hypothetical protein
MNYRRSSLIILPAISYAAAVWVVLFAARGVGLNSPLTAFCAVGAALGIVVVNSSTIHWSLPKALEPIRVWEASGAAYALLGVSICGALLRRPPFRSFNSSVYVREHCANLGKTYANILKAETAHFWALTFTAPLICYEIARQCWHGLVWLILFNALFNIYPGLHLRKVRARLEPLMVRRGRNEKL